MPHTHFWCEVCAERHASLHEQATPKARPAWCRKGAHATHAKHRRALSCKMCRPCDNLVHDVGDASNKKSDAQGSLRLILSNVPSSSAPRLSTLGTPGGQNRKVRPKSPRLGCALEISCRHT